jgi:Caspase domain
MKQTGVSRLVVSIVFTLFSSELAYSEEQDLVFVGQHVNSTWSSEVSTFFSSAKSYAVVIGISNYIGKPNGGYPSLATEKDAQNVVDFLLNNQGYDYVHVLTDSAATKEKIESLMTDEIPSLVGPRDRFLFYFSGHGDEFVRPDTKEAFGFLPVYNSKVRVFSSMISMDDIRRWNQYLQARHVLFILDACFSGLAGVTKKGSPRIDQLTQPAHYLITAGTAGEETIASEKWNGSLFTHELISAVNDGVGATDGVISVFSLIDTIQSRVAAIKNNIGWQKGLTPQIRDIQGSDGAFFFQVASKGSEVLRQAGESQEKIASKGLNKDLSAASVPPSGTALMSQSVLAADGNRLATNLEQRDKAYADLAEAEKQAAASGDWAQVEKCLESIQKAAGEFPSDGRFQKLLDDTRKAATDLKQRDKTYAELADAEKQAAASGDAAQVEKSLETIQKAVGDFPNDSRFQLLLNETRRVATELEQRNKTYAELAAAVGSRDPLQVENSVPYIQRAIGDFPNDDRFQKLLEVTRNFASELQQQTYANLAAAQKQTARLGDRAKVEEFLASVRQAISKYPGDDRFQKLLADGRKVADDLDLHDKAYAELAAAERQAVASGDGAQIGKSVHDIEIAADLFPKDGRLQELLNEASKVWSDLVLRDKTYASLAFAEERAASSDDAAQVGRSLESLQQAAKDYPRDGRFQLLLNKAVDVSSELERRKALRDKTYSWLAIAEEQAVASGDAAEVARSLESLQQAAKDYPRDSRFQLLLNELRKVESDRRITLEDRHNVVDAQLVKSVDNIQRVANTQKGPGMMSAALTTQNAAVAGSQPSQDILDYLAKKNEAILNYHVGIPESKIHGGFIDLDALDAMNAATTPQKKPGGGSNPRRHHPKRSANGG